MEQSVLFNFNVTNEEAKEITLACISKLPISKEQKIINKDPELGWLSQPDPDGKAAVFMLSVLSHSEQDNKTQIAYAVLRYPKGYSIISSIGNNPELTITPNLSLANIAKEYLRIPTFVDYTIAPGIDFNASYPTLYQTYIFNMGSNRGHSRGTDVNIEGRLNTYAIYLTHKSAKTTIERTLIFSVPLLDPNDSKSKHGVEERWFVSATDWTKPPSGSEDVQALVEYYWLFGQPVSYQEYIQYIVKQGNEDQILLPELLEMSAKYLTQPPK